MGSDHEHNLSRKQDDRKQAAHAVEGMNAHIFDIQTLLLVKAIAMFDAGTQSPVIVNLLNDSDSSKGTLVIKTN